MSRRTNNSRNSGSSAQHSEQLRQEEADQILEDEAVAQALTAAQQADALTAEALAAEEEVEALANLDPAAKRVALLAQVNAQNIGGEKEKRIAKGLLIL
jgi:hypothetical protein